MLTKNKDKCASPNPDLIFDEACLDLNNLLEKEVSVLYQYDECVGCDFQSTIVPAKSNYSLLINTKFALHLQYKENATCEYDQKFFEHYRYQWNLTEKCTPIYMTKAADSAYLPILSAFIILFMFGTIWYMVKCIYKCTKSNDRWKNVFGWASAELEHDLGSPAGGSLVTEGMPPIHKHPNRVKSIDVFRGLCIMLMIFVNYGGGQYWFFDHSIWNGITVADLVFPWFMWLIGISLAVSFNNRLRGAIPRRQLFMQVLRRSLILILLGIMINSHSKKTTLATLRFPGVLQRIGLTYFLVGTIEAIFARRTFSVNEYGRFSFLQDVLIAWRQWLVVGVMVVLHCVITFAVDVPACGKGYLGPGGLEDHGHHQNCTGGAAGYIDRAIFGNHMYKKPTCQIMYETEVYYDPEGILGTLTSVLLVYLGVQAGRILHTYSDVRTRVFRWLAWGLIVGLMGGFLCGFSKNNGIIPLNKNLWSLSFVLVLAGMAFMIEAFLFVIVDVTRKWGGRPFFYPGMNPIVLYVGHELFKNTFPFGWAPVDKTHGSYLGINLWGTAVWVAISIFLYKKNIFLTI